MAAPDCASVSQSGAAHASARVSETTSRAVRTQHPPAPTSHPPPTSPINQEDTLRGENLIQLLVEDVEQIFRALFVEKRPKKIRPPAAGETPHPCHLSGPEMISYTFRHQTPSDTVPGRCGVGQTLKRVCSSADQPAAACRCVTPGAGPRWSGTGPAPLLTPPSGLCEHEQGGA